MPRPAVLDETEQWRLAVWSTATILLAPLVILTVPARANDGKTPDVKLAGSYVKVKVEVELRGVLSFTEEAITLAVAEPEFDEYLFEDVKTERRWVLDFGEEKELRAKAKGLKGKTVLIKGSATLLGVRTETFRRARSLKRPPPTTTRSVLELERKVSVKSLGAVTKE
jgi:hypothetical protein